LGKIKLKIIEIEEALDITPDEYVLDGDDYEEDWYERRLTE
jgi:hypothetical protein